MSKFSDRCKQLLEENGTNVYRLSKDANLERTALQRMTTGKRLPNIEIVKDFCQSLRLSMRDETELLELYHMEEIGEDTYLNRQYIIKMMHQLSSFEKSHFMNLNFNVGFSAINIDDTIVCNHESKTSILIYSMLYEECLSEKEAVVDTNLSLNHELYLQYLSFLQYSGFRNLTIHHVLSFEKNIRQSSGNLEMFSKILPFALSDTLNYQAYFTYTSYESGNDITVLYPYFLITSKHVLTLSADFQSAVLYSDSSILEAYRQRFSTIREFCYPLLDRCNNPLEALKRYQETCKLADTYDAYIEYSPCALDLMSKFDFQKAASDCPPELLKILPMIINNDVWDSNLQTNSISFFTQAGLDRFCKEGKMSGNMGMFLPPLNPDERIRYLQNYIRTFNKKGTNTKFMLTDKLPVPSNLFIELCSRNCLCLVQLEENYHFTFITIAESSICSAFVDFMEALPGSNYTYSGEETNQLIDQKISQMRQEGGIYDVQIQ